ncbi:DUF1145 domain-containing protein [Psychromonas sp.]|uniref:DUF1145 domain-containing protein n=1 Tax=Psychromonas sp. TaxID=1884585 RepID=UPI0035630C4E
MRYFITLGKGLMTAIWAVLLYNLFVPFSGQAGVAFYFLLALITFMHLIQLLLIYGAFSEKLKLTPKEALQVFIFGIFKLWQLKGRMVN